MGGMSELRHRRPDEAAASAPDGPRRQDPPRQDSPGQDSPGQDSPGQDSLRQDSPGQDSPRQDREYSERTGIDVRPDRNDGGGYDPDAAFQAPGAQATGLSARRHRRPDISAWSRSAGVATGSPSPANGTTLTRLPIPAGGKPRRVRHACGRETTATMAARGRRPPTRTFATRSTIARRTCYGMLLTRSDGTRIPCLDGLPRRDQTRQGWAGDCGIIAALGAVAAHRPEELSHRVLPQEDGSYQVTLTEARGRGSHRANRAGDRAHRYAGTAGHDENSGTPACAKAQESTAWCAIFEKAFAGIDQTWTVERRVAWMDGWAGLCAQDQADCPEKQRSGPAPTGYVRMHQGTTPMGAGRGADPAHRPARGRARFPERTGRMARSTGSSAPSSPTASRSWSAPDAGRMKEKCCRTVWKTGTCTR